MPDVTGRLTAALADRYRIERELGAGGMATVYLAEDMKHRRKVAVKVLRPELAAVLGAERFVQEITTTAALQHPHILPLFDSGTADGFLYYVMPYVEGETLRAKLDRETQLGIDEAVRITTEVADALDYAHRHGVIHRHQAREYPAPRRPAGGGRFRDRAGGERGSGRADDRDRFLVRHPALHEPRAGHGREGDLGPLGRVLAGERALRDAGRPAAAPGRVGTADHHEDHRRAGGAGDDAPEDGAVECRGGARQGAGETPG